jgi:hypothetical protein
MEKIEVKNKTVRHAIHSTTIVKLKRQKMKKD